MAPALTGFRARDRTSACRAVEGALKGRIWTKAAVNVAHHEIGSLGPMGVGADVILDDLLPQPGFVRIPDGPGLGVRLDWDMIEANRANDAG